MCLQEEGSHRGLKRAHSSSGVASEPKRRSFEQQEQRQQILGRALTGGKAARRSTDPGGAFWRATPPIPIAPQKQAVSGAGGRPVERPARQYVSMDSSCGSGQHDRSVAGRAAAGRRSASCTMTGAAAADPASLSRLLDDTVQLLGQSSLLARQPSAPAIMMHATCSATVRALNASLSSGSLAAQAAAAMEGMEAAAGQQREGGETESERTLQQERQGSGVPPTAYASFL